MLDHATETLPWKTIQNIVVLEIMKLAIEIHTGHASVKTDTCLQIHTYILVQSDKIHIDPSSMHTFYK